jgi:hypothetical protein
MMKTKFGFIIAFLTLAIISCQNDDLNVTGTDDALVLKSGEVVAGDITIESVLEEANYEAELFAQSEMWLRQLSKFTHGKRDLLKGKSNPRYADGKFPVVSIDTAAAGYPITITVEYGDGIELHHGRLVKGTVIVELSAAKDTDGAKRTITYKNCTIDSVQVSGNCVELFSGDNATTRKITKTVNAAFVLADGTKLQKTGSGVEEWLEGLATQQDHSDDKISKTGTQSISSSTGDSWSKTIKEALIRLGSCRHYVKGVVEYVVNNKSVASLNYGDGTCDNLAVMTANGTQVEIELQDKQAKSKGHNSHGKGK